MVKLYVNMLNIKILISKNEFCEYIYSHTNYVFDYWIGSEKLYFSFALYF